MFSTPFRLAGFGAFGAALACFIVRIMGRNPPKETSGTVGRHPTRLIDLAFYRAGCPTLRNDNGGAFGVFVEPSVPGPHPTRLINVAFPPGGVPKQLPHKSHAEQ